MLLWEANKWKRGAAVDARTAAYLEEVRNAKIVKIVFKLTDPDVEPKAVFFTGVVDKDPAAATTKLPTAQAQDVMPKGAFYTSPSMDAGVVDKDPALTKLTNSQDQDLLSQEVIVSSICRNKSGRPDSFKMAVSKKRFNRGRATHIRYTEPVVCEGMFAVPLAAITGNKAVDSLNYALTQLYGQISMILHTSSEHGVDSAADPTVKKRVGGLRTYGFVLRADVKKLGGVPMAEPLAYWRSKYPLLAF